MPSAPRDEKRSLTPPVRPVCVVSAPQVPPHDHHLRGVLREEGPAQPDRFRHRLSPRPCFSLIMFDSSSTLMARSVGRPWVWVYWLGPRLLPISLDSSPAAAAVGRPGGLPLPLFLSLSLSRRQALAASPTSGLACG